MGEKSHEHNAWRLGLILSLLLGTTTSQDCKSDEMRASNSTCANLPITIINQLPSSADVYLTGSLESSENVFLNSQGSLQGLPDNGSTIPTAIDPQKVTHTLKSGSSLSVNIPSCLLSARLWVAYGSPLTFGYVTVQDDATNATKLVEPSLATHANVSYTFMEFAYQPGELFANPTYVDSVERLSLSFQLTASSSNLNDSRRVSGMKTGALNGICARLQRQSTLDGWPWGKLCQKSADATEKWLRVISPTMHLSLTHSDDFDSYFSPVVDSVWTRYASSDDLSILPLSAAQTKVHCTTDKSSDVLSCSDGDTTLAKPSSADIFSCSSGSFENGGDIANKQIFTALAAAFNRGLTLLPRGSTQPGVHELDYYPTNSTAMNWYSKLVHGWQEDGHGYAFPYDDYPDCAGIDSSALQRVQSPTNMTVWISET